MNVKLLQQSEQTKMQAGAIWSGPSPTCGEEGELRRLSASDLRCSLTGSVGSREGGAGTQEGCPLARPNDMPGEALMAANLK